MVTLSVHLITYNNENYIDETLQSILKQKVDFDYEIVIGDDCSSDNTLNIINIYKEKHPNLFKVFKNESQLGILKNFKTTLDKCIGEYVFDIAGDDLLKKDDALQKMVNVLKKDNSLGFIDSGVDLLFEKKKKTKKFSNRKIIRAKKNNYKNSILLGDFIPIGICFNKKHLYKYVDFDKYLKMKITIEDYPILVDLIMNTNFERINESLHVYRVHYDSYSHKKTFENQHFSCIQMKKLFDYFSKKYFFNNELINIYNRTHFKQLLFYAGFFQKKELGIDVFDKIKHKSAKDYIHYYASQNKIFRKLVSLF